MNQNFLIVIMLLFIILAISTISQKYEYFLSTRRKYRGFQIINSPWIINMDSDNSTYQMVNKILQKINLQTKNNFILDKFDNIVEDIDSEGNRHMVIDLFTYQINHQVETDSTRRFIIDLTILDKEQRIRVNTINISNAQIDLSNPNQILDPRLDSASDDAPFILSAKDHTSKPSQTPIGRTTSSLEYNVYKNTPIDSIQHSDYISYPCYQQGDWWDDTGIELNKKTEEKLKESKIGKELLESKLLDPKDQLPWKGTVNNNICLGNKYYQLNASGMNHPQYISPEKYPFGINKQRENHWLFDLLRGITSFPHGISNKS
jgi:hypothetical protein